MKNNLIRKALEISETAQVEKALAFQKNLSKFINSDDALPDVRFIGGVDISYSGDMAFCVMVIIDRESQEKKIVEKSFAVKKISFPYIPGLLFFREFPVLFECYQKISHKPELLIFDGHGLSHQRMMGIATMSGILLNKPSIGCAKSHLYGDYKLPADKRLAYTELKVHGMVVGYVLRSRERVKPIFVSTGFAVSPGKALEITISLLTGYRLPLPTHYAHCESENYKRFSQLSPERE
jgi:deoxyribonuclease V